MPDIGMDMQIDGHGNFGSVDNDPAAAMRYTECRLQHFSSATFLADLDADTVDFTPNFDASQVCPDLVNKCSTCCAASCKWSPSSPHLAVNYSMLGALEPGAPVHLCCSLLRASLLHTQPQQSYTLVSTNVFGRLWPEGNTCSL